MNSLMLFHASVLTWLAIVHSPTQDEIGYLPAGISHWTLGRFELARANPPLVRMLAALPILPLAYETDWRSFDAKPGRKPEVRVGQDFLTANGKRVFRLYTTARVACIPLSLLGAFISWTWARALWGPGAGALAAALWCFCPHILGNGALLTPDVGATSLGLAAGYAYWKWLSSPSVARAALAGIGLGLALLAKACWLVLFFVWPLLLCFWIVTASQEESRRLVFARLCGLFGIGLLSLYVLNLGYGFEGTGTRLGDIEFASRVLRGQHSSRSLDGTLAGNRFHETALGAVPVPLPLEFILGIDVQRAAVEARPWGFLFGEWRQGGWWYYYVACALVRLPLGVLALLACRLVCGWSVANYHASWRDSIVLLAPAVAIGLFAASQMGINRHFRYVLPALPPLYIWVSGLFQNAGRGWAHSIRQKAVLVGFLLTVGSSVSALPHSLCYFNEVAGGPRNGSRYLAGSNTDWGQDLFFLKRWIESHPEARPLTVGWHCKFLDPRLAGIDVPAPPTEPTAGWHIISVNEIMYPDSPWMYFGDFEPVDRVAYSMRVYHLTEEDVQRWHDQRRRQEPGRGIARTRP